MSASGGGGGAAERDDDCQSPGITSDRATTVNCNKHNS